MCNYKKIFLKEIIYFDIYNFEKVIKQIHSPINMVKESS